MIKMNITHSYIFFHKKDLILGKKIIFKATKSFSTLLKKNKIIEDKIVIFTKEIYFEEVNSSKLTEKIFYDLININLIEKLNIYYRVY